MAKQHTDELIARDLADYVEDTAQAIALAVREGRATPNAPALSDPAKRAIYARQLSEPATAALVGARLGKLGTAAVVAALGGPAFVARRPWLPAALRETWAQLGREA